ncbi:MAG: VWA domain-containing protein [Halioglobus sp.]
MQSRLVSFIQVLRSHDVRVSPAETLDAVDVAATLGFQDRSLLRDGLAMTLAKTPEEEAVFLQCFDSFFGKELANFALSDTEEQLAAEAGDPCSAAGLEDGLGAADPQAEALAAAAAQSPALSDLLQSTLMQNLMQNDRNALALAMGEAAQQVNLSNMQIFTQKGQFTRRILDALGEQQIRDAVIELEQNDSAVLPLIQRYRDRLREQVRDYVEREYLLHAEGRSRQFMDEIISNARLNNIDHVYLNKVEELIRRMARKLASRHAPKRRRQKRGQLNMPKTLRRGIANDGVMFDLHWRRVRKEKPQILAVCDVSGSVAAYARFLLLFLYSLQDVLPRVRSFAFSSHLGEVSGFFDDHPVEEAIERVNRKYGGATDYGSSLLDFARLAIDDINSNTTVIILGDARNNNGDARIDVLQSIYQRSKQVIWLNPESRRAWGTGDSEMLRYQSACHFCAECNNLRQLERVIDQLLKSTR